MRTVRVVVCGQVQGVGFRAFTVRRARELGLVGWVRNLADGSVEAEASGAEPALIEFLSALRQGPAPARVVRVTEQWFETAAAPTGFRVTG